MVVSSHKKWHPLGKMAAYRSAHTSPEQLPPEVRTEKTWPRRNREWSRTEERVLFWQSWLAVRLAWGPDSDRRRD